MQPHVSTNRFKKVNTVRRRESWRHHHKHHPAMKQLLFLLTAMLIAVLPAKAQATQVATLSHEGAITTFYSANALKDAYNAAVDGDIITLSSGSFLSVTIKKNITIRGAGMVLDNYPTIISGSFSIECPASETNALTLEGVYANVSVSIDNSKDVKITKCQFTRLVIQNSANFSVANCKFDNIQMNSSSTTGNFINSYLGSLYGGGSSCSYTNCVITLSNFHAVNSFGGSNFTNCIIETDNSVGESAYFPEKTTLSHCYHFGVATDPFRKSLSKTNVMLEGNPFANDNYELAEEYKTICVGNDGTEAGMYGGFLPFDPTPTNPQITKFNVASKTTADGKLSVDIEVKANN